MPPLGGIPEGRALKTQLQVVYQLSVEFVRSESCSDVFHKDALMRLLWLDLRRGPRGDLPSTVKPVSRTTGRSAVAAAAYRAGVELRDERTGSVYDYTSRVRAGSIAEPAYIIVPALIDGDSSWAQDRSTLWNRAEKESKRKDAKTAREIEWAIPDELDETAASSLCREMGTYVANRFRVAVDVARHTPSREGDHRNRHVHLLITTREIAADGFGPRRRSSTTAIVARFARFAPKPRC